MGRTYVALTTLGAGHWVVCIAATREETEELAREKLLATHSLVGGDKETALRNLQVLATSAAKRAYPEAWRHFEYAIRVGIPY